MSQEFQNMTVEVIGKKVVITIEDYTLDQGDTKTGKGKLIAATRGWGAEILNTAIKGGRNMTLMLTAYRGK